MTLPFCDEMKRPTMVGLPPSPCLYAGGMEYHLRQATPADAEALVEMHTLAHEECYSHVLPAEFFAARRASLPERTENRRPSLVGPSAPVIALDDGGRIV